MPRARAKMTRGRLPLQMLQRTKLGCDCRRSASSTAWLMGRKALGCVVLDRAAITVARSRAEMLSSRGEFSAMYIAIMRDTSSRNGWIVTATY